MKLNKRVPVIILPVLFIIFLLIATGLYAVERRSIYSLYHNSAELEATELTGILSRYSLVAKSFLSSLVQSDALRHYLDNEDEHFKSITLRGRLDSMLNSLTDLSSDHFSFALIRSQGEVEYYYESSLDSFSELDSRQREWVTQLFAKKNHSASHFFDGSGRIAFCHFLDDVTLKSPLDYTSENTLAILVAIGPTGFIQRRNELISRNRTITFRENNTELLPEGLLVARKELSGIGTLSVQIQQGIVKKELTNIFVQLSFGFLILIILSHFTLQRLLRKYVTGPVELLERQLAEVDLHATQEIDIYQSNDEIGSLSKTFAQLYDQLRTTYQGTKELAERDSLTTLYNRRVFNLILEKLLRRSAKNHQKVALLYIDIDNFKFVNDQYGHATGDALLRNFALRLHEMVRGGDIVHQGVELESTAARLAGDEFAIIIHGFTDCEVPGKVARRILSLCTNGFSFDKGIFPISLSIGVATYPDDALTTDDLIVNADTAMYQSKKTGKNRISFFAEELAESSRRQQTVEASLKQLDYKELELYYMPIINGRTGEVYAFEALLRWSSRDLGPVSPAEFIPLAESIGIYQDIDLWVLERAFHDSKVIRDRFGDQIRVSINISAAELSQKDFVEKIYPLLDKHAVHPLSFTLEITETFYQDHSDTGQHLMQTLNQSGFQLAIDDLGSGYSSLLQLVEFPIDIVKLDRTFVIKSLASENQKTLHALVEFCHVQGLKVIAEGVETEQEAEILIQNGCDYLQGFHFSKPIALSELLVANM